MSEMKSQQMRERWQDPEAREQMMQVLQDRWKDPERVERVSRSMQGTRQRPNTSGYVSVSWDKPTGLWKAYITCKRKWYFLGRYPTAAEAAKAYNQKAIELFGEDAKLNDVEEIESRGSKIIDECYPGTPALCEGLRAGQSGCPGWINAYPQQWPGRRSGDQN
jgi:hypothetical protein